MYTCVRVPCGGMGSGGIEASVAIATVKVTPKPITADIIGDAVKTYDGNESNVTVTATETIPGNECPIKVINGNWTDVGRYTAEADPELENKNYKLPDGDTAQDYEIIPAPLYIPELTEPYTGNNVFYVEVDGVTPANGTTQHVEVRVTAHSPNVGAYGYAVTDADAVYTASEDSSNYEISGGATLTIGMATPDVT